MPVFNMIRLAFLLAFMMKQKPLKIDLLLPHKERFTAKNAGAVSTVVRDLVSHAKDNAQYRIFGTAIDAPLLQDEFHPVTCRKSLFSSQNKAFAKAYLAHLKKSDTAPDIVEVHGRCQVANLIASARPDLKIILYLHNDPRGMKGAKSRAEREALAHKLSGLISVSHYIESCFFDGLKTPEDYNLSSLVNWLGVERRLTSQPKRKKQILMAGRMVPEKGFLETAKALATILPKHPEWCVQIAGGRSFTSTDLSAYEKDLRNVLSPLGEQVKFLGHIPFDEVRHLQETSEICIVPSLWQEPGGTAVLEAMAAGSALITTNRGGLPEVATGRAVILDDLSPSSFGKAIQDLIRNDDKRRALQDAVWHDYPFSATIMAQKAASFRETI